MFKIDYSRRCRPLFQNFVHGVMCQIPLRFPQSHFFPPFCTGTFTSRLHNYRHPPSSRIVFRLYTAFARPRVFHLVIFTLRFARVRTTLLNWASVFFRPFQQLTARRLIYRDYASGGERLFADALSSLYSLHLQGT